MQCDVVGRGWQGRGVAKRAVTWLGNVTCREIAFGIRGRGGRIRITHRRQTGAEVERGMEGGAGWTGRGRDEWSGARDKGGVEREWVVEVERGKRKIFAKVRIWEVGRAGVGILRLLGWVLVSAVICGEVGEWEEDGRESGKRWYEGMGMYTFIHAQKTREGEAGTEGEDWRGREEQAQRWTCGESMRTDGKGEEGWEWDGARQRRAGRDRQVGTYAGRDGRRWGEAAKLHIVVTPAAQRITQPHADEKNRQELFAGSFLSVEQASKVRERIPRGSLSTSAQGLSVCEAQGSAVSAHIYFPSRPDHHNGGYVPAIATVLRLDKDVEKGAYAKSGKNAIKTATRTGVGHR
ncbi:hypothetical protein C8J57DRAFT_1258068 [Mycena rebaudengoi]|nr:hypothetical protein C8J57DRAFT_1258068 [Mycena rebaudengoi]